MTSPTEAEENLEIERDALAENVDSLGEEICALRAYANAIAAERDALISDNATIMATNNDLANEVVTFERALKAIIAVGRTLVLVPNDDGNGLRYVENCHQSVAIAEAAFVNKPAETLHVSGMCKGDE